MTKEEYMREKTLRALESIAESLRKISNSVCSKEKCKCEEKE